MALLGALAENTRRNERVERGTATLTGSTTVNVPAPMRQMTHFQLTLDDNGTAYTGADPIQISGSLNAAGTILTISAYKFSGANFVPSTTSIKVRYQIWGNLSAGQGF